MRENAVKREFKIGWRGSVLIILTLLSGTLSGYLMYQEYRIKSEFAEIHTEIANETVSITGGSDGPTSVFLAGKITFWVRPDILIVITVMMVIITISYFVCKEFISSRGLSFHFVNGCLCCAKARKCNKKLT